MDPSKCLLFAIFSAVLFSSCFAGIYSPYKSKKSWSKCSYPTWKCKCKVIYNCAGESGDSGFPEDVDPDTVCLKDLAPGDYQMNIAGKRWRRNLWNSKQYCQRECERRLNAFLCLDGDGSLSEYSYAAVCLKLYFLSAVGLSGGGNRPCCEIYLQWGLDWCDEYWYRSVGNLYCYARGTDLPDADGVTSYAFGVESCAAGDGDDYNWCPVDPDCDPIIVI